MDGRTDNVKTVYPLQTKFAGGIINSADPDQIASICYFYKHFVNTSPDNQYFS